MEHYFLVTNSFELAMTCSKKPDTNNLYNEHLRKKNSLSNMAYDKLLNCGDQVKF